ncbi:MAG: hypothetical protein WKG01_42105 [Kofleriaceae bacterium]
MIDVSSLVHQHHTELERSLDVLTSVTSVASQRVALDGLSLGLPAHAEAEATALGLALDGLRPPPLVYLLCSQLVAAHTAQHHALVGLRATRCGSIAWRDRAHQLRVLITHHDEHEAACVIPALRDYLPRAHYDQLASCYATARLQSLVAVPFDGQFS